jgi:UDP-N-acetylglucosamine--N-acetylmuramyl-(pentapeptide) pyrophosphoryl-undecaprenol N-acetylglucosamine transferase
MALGLAAGLPVLLAFGGSKGARSINRALLACLPELLVEMQVVHITGELDWPEVEAARSAMSHSSTSTVSLIDRYHAFPYLYNEMGAALTVADLVLSRAGASTLGEFPLFGLPAILVPYPHAWRYQQVNAQYLERHGAAQIVQDADLSEQLLPVIRDLISSPAKREKMSQAMTSLARQDAAHTISKLLYSLADRSLAAGNTATAKNSGARNLNRQEGIKK